MQTRSFEIDRSTWRFGGDKYDGVFGVTSLLNDKGYMCCLGQICSQLKVPKVCLIDNAEPVNAVDAVYENLAPENLININDNTTASIKWLKQQFPGIIPVLTEVAYGFDSSDVTICNTMLAVEAMHINDEPMASEKRESLLTELFASHGYELKFVGEYQPQVLGTA